MSLDRSTESLNSPSKDNFVPFASYKWSRSNTVRKVNSTPTYTNEEVIKRTSVDDIEVNARRVLDNLNVEHCGSEKLRKYLSESTYRQSLESISEYKAKNSFASQRPPSSSFESLSSDCTDYVLRTATADPNNKSTLLSESSSYLSWIESLNSENCTAAAAETFTTADAKAGEWNNFWLNYNNARNLYLQQQNSCSCNSMSEHAAADEFLDASSSRMTIQKEPSVEYPGDLFYMTRSDMMETIKCCQQIIEILQTAMNKTLEHTRTDSGYIGRQQNRVREKTDKPVTI